MAGHVQDRWFKTEPGPDGKPIRVKSDRHGIGMRYRARYIGPDGTEKSKSFPDRQKRKAEIWLSEIETDMSRGQYVDPKAARTTFRQYAERWLENQLTSGTTQASVRSQITLHAIPYLGTRPMESFQPSHIRAWLFALEKAVPASSYRRVIFTSVSAIFTAAVEDRILTTNPCRSRSVTKPSSTRARVRPWTDEQVGAVRSALPGRYRGMVDVGGGCGLRQGEIFGLPVDEIDFATGWVHVTCQIKDIGGHLVFAPPKREKERDTPMAPATGRALQGHLAEYPPVEVTLPWIRPGGRMVTKLLAFTKDDGGPIRRSDFNTYAWKPALVEAGVIPAPERGKRAPAAREHGMHALRHYFASVLLHRGENPKALSSYLGHSDPGFTLRVYAHLVKDAANRSRGLLDQAFQPDLLGLYAGMLLQQVASTTLDLPEELFRDGIAVVHLHGGRYGDRWVVGVQESAGGPVFGRVEIAPAPEQPLASWFARQWLAMHCEQQGMEVLSVEDMSDRYGPAEREHFVLSRVVLARSRPEPWGAPALPPV
ncbi:site-specific recombinase XerD [Kitasatospora sp. SolWspMP-SS2h]|uniref:tyrosine-type recombinase/integrase n=1 Tax=Kitasatospora sp. SolWspMP-SS2h TaxID=1305729 RepID=UPI000DB965F5|nr:site-specific recombinase XerD [Kitasatospora sp. SolWspMP-SS2h]